MNPGELDTRITIQTPTDTRGSMGGKTETWATFASVWAKREDLRGGEYFAANQMNAQADTRFTIRYLSGVTAKKRIVCDGVTFDIIHVAKKGLRNEWQEILARVHQA